MALSRYRNVNTIDKKFFESVDFPTKTRLDEVPTFKVRIAQFDRLDQLAFKHLGSGEYWWVIALLNDISWAFDFEPGAVIKIPVDVQDVLKLF